MSQERNRTNQNNYERLDAHPFLAKIQEVAANGSDEDKKQIINDFKSSELAYRRVSIGDNSPFDFSDSTDERRYKGFEEMGLMPDSIRLDYVEGSNFQLFMRGYLQGLTLDGDTLEYSMAISTNDGGTITREIAAEDADVIFEDDDIAREIYECENAIRSGVKGKSKKLSYDIISLLKENSFGDLDVHLPVLITKIQKLHADDCGLTVQCALERLIYLEWFGASTECEIETFGFSENNGDSLVYLENVIKGFCKKGNIEGIIFERIRDKYIPNIYMREKDTQKILRIPFQMVSSYSSPE